MGIPIPYDRCSECYFDPLFREKRDCPLPCKGGYYVSRDIRLAFEDGVVDTYIKQGLKIKAIKEYRDKMGIGLKEAKEFVDKRCLELGC